MEPTLKYEDCAIFISSHNKQLQIFTDVNSIIEEPIFGKVPKFDFDVIHATVQIVGSHIHIIGTRIEYEFVDRRISLNPLCINRTMLSQFPVPEYVPKHWIHTTLLLKKQVVWDKYLPAFYMSEFGDFQVTFIGYKAIIKKF